MRIMIILLLVPLSRSLLPRRPRIKVQYFCDDEDYYEEHTHPQTSGTYQEVRGWYAGRKTDRQRADDERLSKEGGW